MMNPDDRQRLEDVILRLDAILEMSDASPDVIESITRECIAELERIRTGAQPHGD